MGKRHMKILFFCRGSAGFIERDIVHLKHLGDVEVFDAAQMNVGRYVQALWSARTKSTGLLYCWFAGRHALFPAAVAKLWHKPLVIVAGGWDVASVPEIQYGLMRGGLKKVLAQWILKSAALILAVSESNLKEILENTGVNPKHVKLIPHGVEIPETVVLPEAKEELVISVGEVTKANLARKGIETFVETARLMPEKRFCLVGRITKDGKKFLRDRAPSNLVTPGYIRREELNQLFRKSAVYVQVSYHEAFGSALAEAMAYGCVPVVTDRFALPEVAGTCGIYVPYGDAQKTAEGIRKAFEDLARLSRAAQERVARFFPSEARRERLIQLLQKLDDDNG